MNSKALVRIIAVAGLVAGIAMTAVQVLRDPARISLTEARAVPVAERAGEANVYLTIANDGPADRLLAASSPDGLVTVYSPEDPVGPAVPQSSVPVLAADGAHLKISGLSGDVDDGRLVPVTLEFEQAGKVTTRARVDAPQATGLAQAYGLFGDGGICIVGDGEPAPKVGLTVAPENDGWRVTVVSDEFAFDRDMMGWAHVPGRGHGHIYLGGMKLARLFESTYFVGALPRGEHIVRVTLNTNDHRAYVVDGEPVTATATIRVE